MVELFTEVATLKQTVAEQREEIARLKGLKGRPNIKPSGMDKGSTPVTPPKTRKRPGRGKVTPCRGKADGDHRAEIPPGCRFKGHQSFRTGPRDFATRDPLPARALGQAGWPDDPGAIARGDRRSFRPDLRRFVPMAPPGAVDDAQAAGLVTLDGDCDFEGQLVRLLNENHQGLSPKRRMFCARGWQHRPGSAQTTPVRVMPARTGFARRSAMSGSHGSHVSPKAG